MKLTIRAYGIAKDILGGRDTTFEVEQPSVGHLRTQLNASYPALHDLRSLFIAVNQVYASDLHILQESDEIVLIPPVSGG